MSNPSPPSEVTALLLRLADGDAAALESLLPLVYDELRRLAASRLRRERPDHTLTPTSLVHEAYLRLTGGQPVDWQGRAHFFGVAARVMRRILVEHARHRTRQKRSRQNEVSLDPELQPIEEAPSEEILAVDEALERLATLDARQARIVELRYFVGLSIEETADAVGISPATVKRDWSIARAWLQRELAPA